ncbi:MAG TPA: alpha/beta hydrolase [Chitinophaga sp.]|uniref:alpha/beta fold hydrolase n=1 Tax=Chitinophaga sp. TaxID=1869181 RepID=UPI002C8D24D7|nr:alpha/beta hydrolase [Chitinophaga sp.]HVI46216.1 alpha/beta hydrolase [Chitinophaga sp.]
MNKQQSVIVLVHGAFGAASNFNKVLPELYKLGYSKIITLDLPGHGKDKTDTSQHSLDSYRDKVLAAIGNENNVVLVGHSMGGVVISAVADKIPGQIKKLVYLTAFLPKDNETLLAITQKDKQSIFGHNLIISADHSSATLKKEGVVDVLCKDCAASDQEDLITAASIPESLKPFATPVSLTHERFGSVPKYYIHATKDMAIGPELQKEMAATAENVVREYNIDGSHFLQLSHPQLVAKYIDLIIAGK